MKKHRLRLARKRSKRGLMLIEVLVVIAIMATITAAVAFAVIPMYKDAQKSTAKMNAAELRKMAAQWRMTHVGEECPDIARLRADRLMDKQSNAQDPWGSPYTIICADDDITVFSPGPDKKIGTEDDIVAPPGAAVARDR
jgi:general secretion pathway protein G